jgi:hypothetical protein
VSFATINLCVASQQLFIVVSIYFIIDSAQKLLDTTSYITSERNAVTHTAPLAPSCATSGNLVQGMAAIHQLSIHHLVLGNESLECLLHLQSQWVHTCKTIRIG